VEVVLLYGYSDMVCQIYYIRAMALRLAQAIERRGSQKVTSLKHHGAVLGRSTILLTGQRFLERAKLWHLNLMALRPSTGVSPGPRIVFYQPTVSKKPSGNKRKQAMMDGGKFKPWTEEVGGYH